jgi:hypothetical protein
MTTLLNHRLSRRASLGLSVAALASVTGARAVFASEGTPAATEDCKCGSAYTGPGATPAASPVANPDLPSGPLGEKIHWLLDLINGDPAKITADNVAPHVTDIVLEEVSAADLAAVIAEVAEKAGPLEIQPGAIATTLDEPPTTAVFRAGGRDGVVVEVTISIASESGLINSLSLNPLGFTLDTPVATPAS